MEVDAIVNAANTDLQMGGGVCGAIFQAAGKKELSRACAGLAPISTGEAVITDGFQLPAKYIVHTPGPVYQNGTFGERELLRNCYLNSLKLAFSKHCESIAFPLISSGIYGYPKEDALRVASDAIGEFLSEHEMNVFLAVFDSSAFRISEQLLGDVQSYIDETYVETHENLRHVAPPSLPSTSKRSPSDGFPLSYPFRPSAGKDGRVFTTAVQSSSTQDASEYSASYPSRSSPRKNETIDSESFAIDSASPENLETLIEHLDESFSATLLRLVDASGKSDAEIYKRANIDRRLFSKIRSNSHYVPSKATVIAFAVALELTLEQTEDLLERAGFALSHSRKFDVIVEYFIDRGHHDIYQINEVLFQYDQPLLGG
jgi:O-acetyl-ADP-ribose deacetylase (regulator of RNase III)